MEDLQSCQRGPGVFLRSAPSGMCPACSSWHLTALSVKGEASAIDGLLYLLLVTLRVKFIRIMKTQTRRFGEEFKK